MLSNHDTSCFLVDYDDQRSTKSDPLSGCQFDERLSQSEIRRTGDLNNTR